MRPQGLLLGGLYALFALSLSLMFGVMRLTNTAQGDFIVLAAFAAFLPLLLLAMRASRRVRRAPATRASAQDRSPSDSKRRVSASS